uniref:Uncharacterized protein n=1 Tax=Brassica oleracea var. oleracea TaxID=109376 RepID=A0A0D3CS46_BRAOL
MAGNREMATEQALGRYVATELLLELGHYIATELWLKLGRYVVTEHSLRSDRAPARARSLRSDRANARLPCNDQALARARSLRSDRAEHAFGCSVATLFELLSDARVSSAKLFVKMNLFRKIRKKDLALAGIEGGLGEIQLLKGQAVPTLDSKETRLLSYKEELMASKGDFDSILPLLKSECTLTLCLEETEGQGRAAE